MSWLIGEAVTCAACGLRKKPVGRSAATEMANGLCGPDCRGYFERPRPDDLWPGETRVEFGYPKACPVCSLPTELLGIPDPARAIEAAREALRAAISVTDSYLNPGTFEMIRAALALLTPAGEVEAKP